MFSLINYCGFIVGAVKPGSIGFCGFLVIAMIDAPSGSGRLLAGGGYRLLAGGTYYRLINA